MINRYFDVFIEYAKADEQDILIKISIHNRAAKAAEIHVLPHVWFRNTWAWGYDAYKPELAKSGKSAIKIDHRDLGAFILEAENPDRMLFCENETNCGRLYNYHKPGTFKDGINDFLIDGDQNAINSSPSGTKGAFDYQLVIPGGKSQTIRLRLSKKKSKEPFSDFDAIFEEKLKEADSFYSEIQKELRDKDNISIQRQAFAGMMWSKQFYYYDIEKWLNGDPSQPKPPHQRRHGRNNEWNHLHNADIISMPDKWEYPWYAAWDLAFHTLPIAMIDPEFAKAQLVLLTKEWYMHPSGQLPAYEWSFSDVNPPVHGWATWRVYKIDEKLNNGVGDRKFLEEVFHKLLLNFTWWVNKKDNNANNIFQGGFLGMDNIGVFDRSAPLPTGGYIEQTDGTSWMAMFTLNMMRISLELAKENPVYQSLATKFFEHFLYIAGAISGEDHIDLWDEEDEFYYDVLHTPEDKRIFLKVRSMVGLIPLFAVEVLDEELFQANPEFTARLEWFLENKPHLTKLISRWGEDGKDRRHLLSLLRGHRVKMILKRMLDESEFLSEYGIRGLSKVYDENPFRFYSNDREFSVKYVPGEAETSMFGGNSNWRGPIWFPVNYLIIESLQRFHHYYGDDFLVEYPTGSGKKYTLLEISQKLSERLVNIFRRDKKGNRPVFNHCDKMQHDEHFRDYIYFYEYFHGDTGRGVGATHQTGWTGLIAKLIQPRRK